MFLCDMLGESETKSGAILFSGAHERLKEGLTDRWCDSLSTVANSDPQFLLILGEGYKNDRVGAALLAAWQALSNRL